MSVRLSEKLLESAVVGFEEMYHQAVTERDALIGALREHDGWLERTGHGIDHPWRLSIARALAKHAPKVTA